METLYYVVVYPLQLIIEQLFDFCYHLKIGIGLTIFVVSLFVNLGSLPMFLSAYKLQKKERDIQEKMAPKVKSIRRNFKGAEKFMLLSTYYRQNHYHPIMSLRISLSLLLEIPFFTAAYLFFTNLDMLNGMSWWFIKNLSLPDGLLKINNLSINVLPIIMTIFNIVSCEIYMKGFKLKDKIQIYTLAFIFLVILYNSPSGLVLYWTFNNLISLVRSFVLKLSKPKKCLFLISILMFGYMLIKIPSYILVNLSVNIFSVCLFLFVPISFYIIDKKNIGNNLQENKLFVLSLLLISLLIGCVVPTNLIASDTESFFNINYTYFNLLFYPFFQSFGLFLFWPICFYFFLSQKYKKILLYCSVPFLFFAVFQILTYKNIGQISTKFTLNNAWGFYYYYSSYDNIINLCCFLFIMLFSSFLLYKKYYKILFNIFYILLFSMSFLICLNGIKIYKSYLFFDENYKTETELKKEIHLSKNNKNIIIFMVDSAISSFLPIAFDEKKELKDIYTGFIYYPNCVSHYTSTILGLPPILGGYEYIPKELNKQPYKIQEKIIESFFVLPKILEKNDWEIALFDLPIKFFNRTTLENDLLNKYKYENRKLNGKYSDLYGGKYIDNYKNILKQNYFIQKKNFLLYSIILTVPHIFKDSIYENMAKYNNSIEEEQIDSYSSLFFLPQITDFDSDKNNFIFINNLLTHGGQFLDYPNYKLNGKVTVDNKNLNFDKSSRSFYHTNMAMFLLIGDFIKYLKENNVYDNTKIIIVSDHGRKQNSPVFSKFLNEYLIFVNPLLFVKDFNARGEYKTDLSFMTNADVPLIAIKDVINEPINPFTNNILTEEEKKNGVLLTYGESMWNAEHFVKIDLTSKMFKFNYVKDNVFDEKNWIIDYKYEEENN